MSYTNHEIIKRFAEGKTKGRSHNVFIDDDILYSYGYHFPMMVRRDFGFLLNVDKYSRTTSAHQSGCWQYAHARLPFSLLKRAGISYMEISIVSFGNNQVIGPTKWYKQILMRDSRHHHWSSSPQGTHDARRNRLSITNDEYNELPKEYKANWSQTYNWTREALVLCHQDRYYLLIEERYRQYSLSELPRKAETVEEAFISLTPEKNKQRRMPATRRMVLCGSRGSSNAVLETRRCGGNVPANATEVYPT